jgi:hypothetical protein
MKHIDTTNRRTGKPASQSPGESRIKKTAASSKSPQTTHKAPKGQTPSHWEGVDLSNHSEVRKALKADPICVLCGDKIKPPINLHTGLPCEGIDPEHMGCNPWPLAEKGQCCHECDTWVLAARCGHSIASGLKFVRKIRSQKNEAIAEYLANKNGGVA